VLEHADGAGIDKREKGSETTGIAMNNSTHAARETATRLSPAQAQQLHLDAKMFCERGWPVVPFSSSNGNKRPLVQWKPFVDRLPTDAELRAWFGKAPGERGAPNGVGVITGGVAGALAIRDFDDVAAYQRWEELNPTLAKSLPTVRTARGYHVWARSDLRKTLRAPGGEYRGNGVSLAPHSVHESGVMYKWIIALPKAGVALPEVDHRVLIAVAETAERSEIAEPAESHCSALSAVSALSATVQTNNHKGLDIDTVIRNTLPSQAGERNACLMRLARGLKFNVGSVTKNDLRPIVVNWHRRALPVITTKDFDETWADFIRAYEIARHPLGNSLVDVAASRVDMADLPPVSSAYDSDRVRWIIGLCAILAELNGGRQFFLSSHDLAGRLSIAPVQAYRLLKMLEFDDVIRCVKRGNAHAANRYIWNRGS
jgi:hypothetical protein